METLKLDLKLIILVLRNYRKNIACNVSSNVIFSCFGHIRRNPVIHRITADIKLITDYVFTISKLFCKIQNSQRAWSYDLRSSSWIFTAFTLCPAC